MYSRLPISGLLFLALGAIVLPAAHGNEVADHVGYLASEELEGRLTGTPGARKAAAYLAAQLREMGATTLPGAAVRKLMSSAG